MAKGIHLVLPMAGEGQRFQKEGISTPKPLIPINGFPMYQLVVSNLFDSMLERITLVARQEFELEAQSELLSDCLGLDVSVVSVGQTTGGPADSVELALPLFDLEAPVVVANSDQWIDFPIGDFYRQLVKDNVSGNLLTMQDNDPKWSYAEIDKHGEVIRVVEKEVISSFATVGIYGFRRAVDMLNAFSKMRNSEAKVNNEYYVGPAYNFLSRTHGPVLTTDLGPFGNVMHGLGTPEDLRSFLANPISWRASQLVDAVLGRPLL
jgi:NDP-sugar pyrophosphorylase family protein